MNPVERNPSPASRAWQPRPGWVALLFLPLACSEDPTGGEFPETQGIDPTAIEEVYTQLRGLPGSFSLLVQRNGELVAEEYFHGFTPDSLHDVRSVTKSVISILVGIAIRDGSFPSPDAPIGDYLAPTVDSIRPALAQTPIRAFLKMSSGLDWHELDRGSSYSDWWRSDDMIQFVVDLPIVHEPEQQFIYNTGASHLLSVALTEATGMPTLEFAREVLFGPLGFSGSSWLQENRGYFTGGMGLRITSRDMLKVGQMFLDQGVFQGEQVVPSAWVQESTQAHLPTHDVVPYAPEYGYLWWVGEGGGKDFYLASGYGGQFILVDPDFDLVIVAQSNWRGKGWDEAGEQWFQVITQIVEGLLPGVR